MLLKVGGERDPGVTFFDNEVPSQLDNFARATFLDKSSDDRLGRLAEINKSQMEQAMREMRGFARTDAGFNSNEKNGVAGTVGSNI